MDEGAETADVYGSLRYALLRELPDVGLPEIDVPFPRLRRAKGDGRHGEAGLQEGFIHFRADLERRWADAGAYDTLDVSGLCAVSLMQRSQGQHADAGYRAPPSGMRRSDGSRAFVIEKERHTIGRGDADAHMLELRDECIGVLEQVVAVMLRDLRHPHAMHLSRHDEALVGDAEMLAKLLSAGLDMRWRIAGVVSDVETVVGR